MGEKTLEKCYPNAHGWLKLVAGDDYWYVIEPDAVDRDDITDFTSEAEARSFYEERAKYWADEPNWEAQARYDEEHGTENGYAPWQLNREY